VVLSPIPQTIVAVMSRYLPDKLPAQAILQAVPEDAAEQSQPIVMPQALGLTKVIIVRQAAFLSMACGVVGALAQYHAEPEHEHDHAIILPHHAADPIVRAAAVPVVQVQIPKPVTMVAVLPYPTEEVDAGIPAGNGFLVQRIATAAAVIVLKDGVALMNVRWIMIVFAKVWERTKAVVLRNAQFGVNALTLMCGAVILCLSVKLAVI